MNDYVMVNFLLEMGSMIAAAILREDADRLMRQHADGKLPLTVGSHNHRVRADVLGFSIDSTHIRGVYLTAAPPIQPQPAGYRDPLSSGARWGCPP